MSLHHAQDASSGDEHTTGEPAVNDLAGTGRTGDGRTSDGRTSNRRTGDGRFENGRFWDRRGGDERVPRERTDSQVAADEHADLLRRRLGLSRRRLFAATTGLAAAAALPFAEPAAAAARTAGRATGSLGESARLAQSSLIPPAKRGIILYTVRDAIGRDPLSTSLPSGFRRVLEELSRIGYQQVEFAGYRQHANAEGGANLETVQGAQLLRRWLDDNGLRAQGNHGFIPSSWPLTTADRDRFKQVLEIANILGLEHVGTGSDPTNSSYKRDWDIAAEKWNELGRIAADAGLKLYTHNHDAAYGFLLDSGPLDAQGRWTRSSGIRKLEYFFGISHPRFVYFEMDVFWAHVARFKHRTYTAPDGSTQTDIFDPLATVQARQRRFPLFHAKDGDSNPAVANGYDMVPFGTGDIDYRRFFSGLNDMNAHNPMYEQDNAPGTDPAQSLAYAALSYGNMSALSR